MPEGGTKPSASPKKGSGRQAGAKSAAAQAVRRSAPKRKSAAKPAVEKMASRPSTKKAIRRAPTNPAVGQTTKPKPDKPASALFGLDYMTVFILLGGLALAAINLAIIVQATGRANALEEARNLMQANYRRAVEQSSELAAFKKKLLETPPPLPEPRVLWSVVEFRDNKEKQAIQDNLIDPLLDWHEQKGPRPEAVLLERRFATSENVSVRLFLADGSEKSFLWPDEGAAEDSLWLPPCGPNSPAGLEKPVACPTQFLLDYPEITDDLLNMSRE